MQFNVSALAGFFSFLCTAKAKPFKLLFAFHSWPKNVQKIERQILRLCTADVHVSQSLCNNLKNVLVKFELKITQRQHTHARWQSSRLRICYGAITSSSVSRDDLFVFFLSFVTHCCNLLGSLENAHFVLYRWFSTISIVVWNWVAGWFQAGFSNQFIRIVSSH